MTAWNYSYNMTIVNDLYLITNAIINLTNILNYICANKLK